MLLRLLTPLKKWGDSLEEVRCVKCRKLLATIENGWFQIRGQSNISSDGEEFRITCKYGKVNIYKI